MYENKPKRCRYGDPLYIAKTWGGVPDGLDGYAQTLRKIGRDFEIKTYFFKGECQGSFHTLHSVKLEKIKQ